MDTHAEATSFKLMMSLVGKAFRAVLLVVDSLDFKACLRRTDIPAVSRPPKQKLKKLHRSRRHWNNFLQHKSSHTTCCTGDLGGSMKWKHIFTRH